MSGVLRQKSAKWLFIATIFFVQIGHAGSISRMAVIGDAGKSGTSLEFLKRSIAKEEITSLIMPGDNLYSGTYESVWDSWKEAGFQFDVVALGNHHGGYWNEVNYFGMPGEYFSTVKSGARFIVLNSDNTMSVDQQFAWLEKEMVRVQENLVFLVFHHPTFTVSPKHNWQERREFQLKMRQFLKSHGSKITALLIGHDHISTFIEFGSIPVVLAGSGREARPADPVFYTEDGFQIRTRYLAPQSQHWAVLEVNEGTLDATVHFVRVSDQKKVCSAQLSQGKMQLQANCEQ